MTIGERIKAARKEKKLTQKRLGELLGYTGRSAELMVQHWERGRRQVPIEVVKPMSKILDIPLEDLIP